jgi:molybdopterin molybdotransferase
LIFGRLDGVPLLGLPGNPVSAGVTSAIFLRDAMAVMLGLGAGDAPEFAVLGVDLAANDRRQDYLRATLSVDDEGNRTAHPFEGQDSSMLARLAQADCLVVRPPEAPPAKAGERVEIIPLRKGMVTF